MTTPKTLPSESLDDEITASVRRGIADMPVNGESLDDLPTAERITIEATNLRKIEPKTLYRVLYPDGNAEIALIITADISSTLTRAALADLISHSVILQKKNLSAPLLGALIYLEYQDLMNNYGWKTKDVMEQVTYDFNITWLMMKTNQPGSDPYKYAEMFRDGLIDYIRIPDSKIQGFLSFFDEGPDSDVVPFQISTGFKSNFNKSCRHITDKNKAWKKMCEGFNLEKNFTGVLICFWCISCISGYWTDLNDFPEMKEFKRKHREESIAVYIDGIEKFLPSLYQAEKLTPHMLEEFLKYIKEHYPPYIHKN